MYFGKRCILQYLILFLKLIKLFFCRLQTWRKDLAGYRLGIGLFRKQIKYETQAALATAGTVPETYT